MLDTLVEPVSSLLRNNRTVVLQIVGFWSATQHGEGRYGLPEQTGRQVPVKGAANFLHGVGQEGSNKTIGLSP